MVALYWLENFLLTYWFISEVLPTPLSPKIITFSSVRLRLAIAARAVCAAALYLASPCFWDCRLAQMQTPLDGEATIGVFSPSCVSVEAFKPPNKCSIEPLIA